MLLRYMADRHPEALRLNLDLIGVYGRYDDLYCLIGTPLEDEMWAAMKKQFEEDRQNMQEGNAVSLLAKWIKTADASSAETRKLGILTAQKLGYPVYEFKRLVRAMRKKIGVVETLMSAGRWDEITYSAVPSGHEVRRHGPGEGYGEGYQLREIRSHCGCLKRRLCKKHSLKNKEGSRVHQSPGSFFCVNIQPSDEAVPVVATGDNNQMSPITKLYKIL